MKNFITIHPEQHQPKDNERHCFNKYFRFHKLLVATHRAAAKVMAARDAIAREEA